MHIKFFIHVKIQSKTLYLYAELQIPFSIAKPKSQNFFNHKISKDLE